MAEEQLEWVFDSLVEFLRGPIWNIPVLTFIEQKSVVFEPGAENEEELKKIHEAYKNLVDFMLGSYMEDLRISPEEFEKSCSVASKKALNQFHQSLFQQVWAADDFEIFKRMMTQKNLELQLQALEFLTQKRGSVPDCMEPNTQMKEDEKAMEDLIKKTIENVEIDSQPNAVTPTDAALQEKMRLEAQKEKELLEEAINKAVKETTKADVPEQPTPTEDTEKENSPTQESEASVNGIDEETDDKEVENDENENEAEPLEIVVPAETASNDSSEPRIELPTLEPADSSPVSAPKTLPPLKTPEERPWSEGDLNSYSQTQAEVTPLELEKRQKYLREQRDRILAMKRQERARRLSTTEEVISQARPKSAHAARKILREESTEVDPQTLMFRKTLAAKLRSEVVDRVD